MPKAVMQERVAPKCLNGQPCTPYEIRHRKLRMEGNSIMRAVGAPCSSEYISTPAAHGPSFIGSHHQPPPASGNKNDRFMTDYGQLIWQNLILPVRLM